MCPEANLVVYHRTSISLDDVQTLLKLQISWCSWVTAVYSCLTSYLAPGGLSTHGAIYLSHVYFKVDIIGRSNVPAEGPIIFTGNHANQFVDALQVSPRGTIFRSPKSFGLMCSSIDA